MIYDGKEERIDFDNRSIGYNFEVIHFNELIRLGKTESPIMTLDFSRNLMRLLDDVRNLIGLEYTAD